MLKIIIGRGGSGKTTGIMDEMKEAFEKQGKKSVLIVPEQFSHDAERHLCAHCGNTVSLYGEVISFSRLAQRVLVEQGKGGKKLLNKSGRVLVMNKALSEVMPKLKIYQFRKRKTDFLKELLNTYDEFKNECIGSDMLMLASQKLTGTLSDKLYDLALIFSTFEAFIPEGVIDKSQKNELVAECIGESDFGRKEKIFIDGFTDFTLQEIHIIEELFKKDADVTVCLTCDELDNDEPAFELPVKTAYQLMKLAKKRGNEIEIIKKSNENKSKSASIIAVERSFGGGLEKAEECDPPEIYKVNSPADECQLAAYRINALIREKGYRYRDFAVTSRDWPSYEGTLENIFEKYDIPTISMKKEDILQKPIMSLVTSALDTVEENWSYESVFSYLKTNLTGISFEDRDILENYVIKWNIRGRSMWLRDESWTFNPEGYEAEITPENKALLERINEIKSKVTEPFLTFESALKKGVTVEEKTTAICAFLEDIKLPERLEEKAEQFENLNMLKEKDEYIQLWDIIVDAMEQLVLIMGGESIDTDEYIKLFKLLISQYEVGTIPSAIDRVGIGDMMRMRRRNIKCLIILGASDDKLPSYNNGHSMLSDEDKLQLIEAGINLSDTVDERFAREMSIIYSSVSMPDDKLIITYSAGFKGEKGPSFIVSDIKKIFGIKEEKMPDKVQIYAENPCFELALAGDSEYSRAAEKYFSNEKGRDSEIIDIKKAVSAVNRKLTAERAAKLFGEKINITASRAEKYNSCRFAYFMQYGLKAKARKKAGFDAPETGTFMHYILENVAKEAEKLGGFGKIDRKKCDEIVSGYVKIYISEYLDNFKDKSPRFRYLFSRLVKDVYSIVRDMANELEKSEFKPIAFEMDFSSGGDMPPAELHAENTDVTVNGKIDRVDGWIHNDKLYLKVVDYKTGRKEFSLSDVWYGMGIQMLIYLFVLQKKGEGKYHMPIEPAGILYTPARDVILNAPKELTVGEILSKREAELKRKGIILDDAEVIEAMEPGEKPKYIPVRFTKKGIPTGDAVVTLEELGIISKHIDKVLTDIGRDLRSGRIDADPFYKSPMDNACMYCDYKDACRFTDGQGNDQRRQITKLKTPDAMTLMRKECEEDGK